MKILVDRHTHACEHTPAHLGCSSPYGWKNCVHASRANVRVIWAIWPNWSPRLKGPCTGMVCRGPAAATNASFCCWCSGMESFMPSKTLQGKRSNWPWTARPPTYPDWLERYSPSLEAVGGDTAARCLAHPGLQEGLHRYCLHWGPNS